MPSTPTPAPLDKEAGRRLRALRRARGLSQQALGAALGLSFQQVQKYEQGVNQLRLSRLYQLAQVLAVPVSELLPSAPFADELADHPNDSQALSLMRHFRSIGDPHRRALLSDLARTFAA